MEWLKRRLKSAAIIFGGFAILTWWLQNWLIFHPSRLDGELRLPDIPGRQLETVTFTTRDGVSLQGVWMGPSGRVASAASGPATPSPPPSAAVELALAEAANGSPSPDDLAAPLPATAVPPAPATSRRRVVLMSHGNAGHLGGILPHLAAFATMPVDVFCYDYRGFGASSGTPDVPGVIEDGLAALRYLHERRGVASEDVILLGFSLGTGVSTTLLQRADMKVAAVVLEAPFLSLRAMAAATVPVLGAWLLSHDLPSDRILADWRGPLLVLHAPDDRVIPFAQGKALFDLCPSPTKEFIMIDPGMGGHGTPFWLDPRYQPAFIRLLANAAR